MDTASIIQIAKQNKTNLAVLDTATKNSLIENMANCIWEQKSQILEANALDLNNAKETISSVMLDRLMLNESRIQNMVNSMKEVINLPDPVGRLLEERNIKENLTLKKISVPIGVIAIIYESRPNVTSDAATLCLKSGNVCVLKCGKESYNTSCAIIKAMQDGLNRLNFPKEFINIVEDTSRESSKILMKAHGLIDLLIPRGGSGLIKECIENATVPCIETGTGICTVYIDSEANIDMALNIIENAKTQRPSVCNAEETLLIHEKIAPILLPKLKERLVDHRIATNKIPVELRLCENSLKIITGTPAKEDDYNTEFLDYILAVKIVKNVEEAVKHISVHSTQHSESIITDNKDTAAFFASHIDSAAIYINASTRFTDGGEFGFGCEMGISTQKLHARGPMGLNELTTYKYIVTGNGNIR